MTTQTIGADEVIDEMCPKVCSQCGETLPRPGEECGKCGELPRLLRQEAAEQLAEPGKLAAAQAARHRAEAKRLLDEQIAELVAADRVLLVDALQQARDRAENELTAAIAARDQAEAALKEPRKAEARSGRERAEAEGVHRDYDLELRKAERYQKGARVIVEARRRVELAAEVLAAKNASLQAVQDARRHAEDVLAAADGEVRRCTAVRDSAAARLAKPPEAAMSTETMNALALPVRGIVQAVAPLRLSRPASQFTVADVAENDLVAFALAFATLLGELTGILSARHAAGVAAGREQAEGEANARPKLVGTTVLAPGSQVVNGGIYSPGHPGVMHPGPGLPR